LGLLAKFKTFDKANPDLFKYLAASAPAYVDRKMSSTKVAKTNTRTSTDKVAPTYIGMTNEKAVTTYFSELILAMDAEVTEHNKDCDRRRSSKTKVPPCEYYLEDHQSKAIKGGSCLKADFAFYYPGSTSSMSFVHILLEAKKEEFVKEIRVETLKQIADYQTNIWQTQPSRVYVPILLLHGAALTMVVFTRNNWYVADIGRLCYTSIGFLSTQSKAVRSVMVQLYLLLMLAPEEFGHFCGLFKVPSCWRFDCVSDDSMDVIVTSSDELSPSVVKLVSHMQRAIYPRHRLAHIFEADYKGQRVFLKLSWVPVSTTPEGAIYELLKKSGVSNIPDVYESGILARDQLGYRLEYLVLEHCGCSIERYLLPMVGEARSADVTYVKVRSIVSSTLRCLALAFVLCGILDRDISMGNVLTGLDGSVKVINWGYGKLLPAAGLSREAIALRKLVAAKWGFQDDSISLSNQPASAIDRVVHNPLTETPLYMSVPVLCGATARGPIDEIESLFYVTLHALSALENSSGSVIRGFTYHDNNTLAMVRISCLAHTSAFLQFFGVMKGSRELHQLLYKLREYLFVDNGVYIAPLLVFDPYTPRGNNPELLSAYIDTETMDVLQDIKSA
ncbi:hypothetical protein H4R27_006034, partial [Coemansia aciculifera]